MALDTGKTNGKLGEEVHNLLVAQGVETPTTEAVYSSSLAKEHFIEARVREIMGVLGLDLTDDSLQDTPTRVAKMFVRELFWGLDTDNFPKCTTVENKMGYDEMVLVRDISVMSQCEHHWQNIVGVAHVAYIPNDKVLGLSKLNRVVEYFARRPQIQERMTEQVYFALAHILGTPDVAVVIEADHYCVKARGIQDGSSRTTTSKLGGGFKDNPSLRAEFINLLGKK